MDERAANVIARADVAWTLVDDRVVVAGPASAALDPVSSVFWRCLDGTSPLREVSADVAEAFGVPAEQALEAFVRIVDSWVERGLVVEALAHGSASEHGDRWRRLVDPPDA